MCNHQDDGTAERVVKPVFVLRSQGRDLMQLQCWTGGCRFGPSLRDSRTPSNGPDLFRKLFSRRAVGRAEGVSHVLSSVHNLWN